MLACFVKIFVTFLGYQKGTPVVKEVRFGNVPEFSDVHFCESFGYLVELSKLLTERIALYKTKYRDSVKLRVE